MSEESVDIEGWSLGEQLEAGGQQIRGVRLLEGWEYLQIVEDNTMLTSLTIGTDWTAVLETWTKVSSGFVGVMAAASAGKDTNEQLKVLNSHVVQLLHNLGSHFKKLETAKKYLPESGLQLERFESAIRVLGWEHNRQIVDGSDWRAFDSPIVQVLLVEKAPGRVEAVVSLTARAANALELPTHRGLYIAEPFLNGLLGVADRAIGCLMASSREAHEAACARLRKSCLEVFAEVPTIFRYEPKNVNAANIKMLQIRLDLIPVLHRGTVLGEGQIQEIVLLDGGGEDGTTPTTGDQSDAGEMLGGEGHDPSLEGPDAGDPPKPEPEGDDSVAATTEADEGPQISLKAADLEGMIREFVEISNELEERWSEALEVSLSDAAVKAEIVRWSAVIQTLFIESESRATTNALHGVDNTVEIFPVPIERFREFAESASLEERYRQSVLGSLYTIKTLSETLEVLQVPVNENWDLASGVRRKWWSSGGFTAVSDAARVAVRANAELNVIHKQLLAAVEGGEKSDEPDLGLRGFSDAIFLAERALGSGMPQAALYYLLKGAANWQSATGKELLSAPFLDAVRELLKNDLDGGSIPLGISVPLANMGLAEVRNHQRDRFQAL